MVRFFVIFSLCFSFIIKNIYSNTIIITCATGELGSEIASNLAPNYDLLLLGRDRVKLQSLQEKLQAQFSNEYHIANFDYTNTQAIDDLKKKIASLPVLISGLVLMTPLPHFSSDLLQEEADWNALFQSTFIGPVQVLKEVIPCFQKGGKIVIIGGTTSVQLMPEYGPACIIRRMWTTYSKALSHKLGPKGIHVNVVSPGIILTNFHKDRIGKKADESNISFAEQLRKETAQTPLGRYAKPSEIANVVRFMLTEDSDFVTGTNLIVDGGVTVSY